MQWCNHWSNIFFYCFGFKFKDSSLRYFELNWYSKHDIFQTFKISELLLINFASIYPFIFWNCCKILKSVAVNKNMGTKWVNFLISNFKSNRPVVFSKKGSVLWNICKINKKMPVLAKRDNGTGVFLWILQISQSIVFTEHFHATASVVFLEAISV